LSVIAVAAIAMPAAAQDNNEIDADRTIDNKTIAPGDKVQVTVNVEIKSAGDSLDIIDNTSRKVKQNGSSIDKLEGDFDPFNDVTVSAIGVQGVAIIFSSDKSWSAGDTVTLEYTLNTTEDLTDADTITLSSQGEYNNSSYAISGDDTITVEEQQQGPEDGPLTIDAEPGEAGTANTYRYTFDAANVSSSSDVATIRVDFDDGSGVDPTAISKDDMTVDAAGSTVGVDATSEADPGVLEVTLGESFVLGTTDGDVLINISAVDVPNDGSYSGGVEFYDGNSVLLASGSESYSIVASGSPTATPTDGGTPTATPTDGGTPTATSTDDFAEGDGPGFGAILGLIAVLSAALLLRRRQ
jgi:PGF-CTERM protein